MSSAAAKLHLLVTGAGNGIGKAIALAASRTGMAVSVNDVLAERADETVRQIRAARGRAQAFAGDISEFKMAGSIVEQAIAAQGDLTGLVNNAGIVQRGTIRELVPDDWERTIRVNLLGVAYMTHHAFESLARTHGAIVNLASIASVAPTAASGGYTASKAGVAGLTMQTALEGGPYGIRCNAIGPGFISGTALTADNDADPVAAQARADAVPLRRRGLPEDVADVAVFLLSDASRYVSGQLILVDGGLGTSLVQLANRRPETAPMKSRTRGEPG